MDQAASRTYKWDPDQYSIFAAERARPFFDLLALVEPAPGGDVVDLGCGTGELTARLHEHTRAATTTGIDNSETMLARALPLAGDGLGFRRGDIAALEAERAFDVVYANASLQWVPDHPRLLSRLALALRPGGQLAIQVPANGDHPSQMLPSQVAREAPFASYTGDARPPESFVCAPEKYAVLLHDLGFVDQHVRLQVYGHTLSTTDDVVEWTKATTLLRFQEVLPAELFDAFVERYRERLREEIGERSPYFYTFKRILMWARCSGAS